MNFEPTGIKRKERVSAKTAIETGVVTTRQMTTDRTVTTEKDAEGEDRDLASVIERQLKH